MRLTVFTVYFKPFDLDLGVITQLRNEWADAYPGFKQAAPKTRRTDMVPHADLFALTWPMPAAQLADSSLSRTLGFQFDQFSLTWKFDADVENSGYPGYATLADELIERFSEFVRVVDSSSDSTVVVEGCQCYYTNTLDGIGGQRWLSTFLSGQANTTTMLDDAVHFGFRVYREDEVDGTKRAVNVQMDAGKEQPPEVDIFAVAAPADDAARLPVGATELARKLLDAAHNLENQTFESSFSETMKSDWEARS
ncbi:hypothetical protein [Mycobacterium sp. ENV421]|uniref:hypothetical protein n=1 Tax=Mycobacterium sp. ENV421 TaxID=1213407 RepID=UPI0011580DF9|nr:hypothetical protein [Mycobacterium sp. ENV421]